ncbi:28S ribosomal protein S10, mitochondrial [Thrips palmi]|uniref:Small ribosomal subunit protein uS10m n=1 Tax=Thrips palmi TaxID=161013 RepID=A0A6P8ZS99_THRPL|nr:28S ribosomal protein S10, mitochondrial [Thrips palmi]
MFAVKQAVRSLGRHWNSNVVPRIPTSASIAICNGPLKPQAFTALRSCLQQTRGFVTTPEQAKQKLAVQGTETTPVEAAEPDTLYHMIEIEIRCGDRAVIRSYNTFIVLAAKHLKLNIEHSEPANKYRVKRWIVLKSRHVHRKHMVTYEVRTYHHTLRVVRLTGSTADTFLEYIQRNLPEGVSMRVGRVRMEKLPEHLLTPPAFDN